MPLRIPEQSHLRRRKVVRRARASKPSTRIARLIYKDLEKLFGPMFDEVGGALPWIQTHPNIVSVTGALRTMLDRWRRIMGPSAKAIAAKWTSAVSEYDRRALEKSLAKVLGIDTTTIWDDRRLLDATDLMRQEAVSLISSFPDKYFADVERAVMDSYAQVELPNGDSLTERIQHLTGLTYDRAKLVAVDQTNKIHCAVTQARQMDLGIEEYIWRTAKDQRVVGNPAGLYPSGNRKHGNHWDREGKIYRWDEPPFDGHPGWPIRCRCYAEPVINYDKLNLK